MDTDTQYVSVTAPPPDPEISITGLVTQMEEGQSDSFTVSASDLVSSNDYTIRVTTNNSDIGFNSSCSDTQEDATVTSGSTSYSGTFTLYGCDTSGGTVTATLRRGSTTVDTATQVVTVKDPSVSITGLVTEMEDGQSDSFTVSASDLASSNDYTIRVTTSNSDIGFNSSCSDTQEDATVTSGSTSYSGTFTLYGCDTSGGTVTATLRRGSTIVDTATQVVTVKDPSVSITGLVTEMEDGQSDSFTVSASDLASSNDYTIRVTTSNSDIGFETGCSNIQKVAIVPDTSTSHSATFTLYGCAVTSGTVTATLLRGSTIVDTATQSVTVKNQSIVISGLLTHIEEGGDDEFVVTASSLVSSNRYTIQVATSNSDIGFETGCSNVQKVAIVPDTSTSHSATFTLYGCDVTAGTVTATLIRSGAVVASDTFDVTVKPPVSMSLDSFLSPSVIVEGRSHEFRVLTYNTVPGRTYRVMTSVDPSGTTDAGFNSGCTDSSRNSSPFDGTASEVASSFTLWACNATTTTMTLWVQLQVQDPGGTTWSDFGPFDEEFSVLPPPVTSAQQNFGDIPENSFNMIGILMMGNPPASRLLLRVDESAGRAHVIEVLAERSMGDPVGVNRITVHTDSTYSEPPGYKYLRGNQIMWVAPSSATSSVRLIVLEVVKPLLGSGIDLTGYRVTISEPNVALIERPTPTLSGLVIDSTTGEVTAGSVYLPLRVRNSSASLAGARVSVVCFVDRGGTRITAGRSHGTFFVGAGPTETDLAVTSICQGIVLQQGDEISLTAEVAQGKPIHKHSVHATGTVAWEHDMASTLFHSHSSHLMGGLQIDAGGSACTSSFTLTLLDLSNSPATDYEAISTTEHCAEHLRHDWYQGPIPTYTAQYIADTTVVATVTPCNLLIPLDTSTTSTEAMNCTIGDQSYGEEVAAAGATFDHGFIFKPGSGSIANSDALHRPKIQYFTGVASTTRFRIDSARPPYDTEMVHKVGRTTGWTSGKISRPSGLTIREEDPTCPGGYVDAGFNTRKDGDDTYTECQSYTVMAVARGDSGSPVFSRIGTTDDVVLVGVLFSQTEDKGIFIPIDRVYAESLKQGFDWDTSQQQLRPIPAPIGITPMYDTSVGTTTLSVKATFRKRDFSPSLYYEADFLREGAPPTEAVPSCYVTTPERTQLGYSGHDDRNTDNGNNCTVATSTLVISGMRIDTVEVSFHGLDADLTGTFSVKLRACKETGAVSPSSRCGGYGTNGNQTVTLAR